MLDSIDPFCRAADATPHSYLPGYPAQLSGGGTYITLAADSHDAQRPHGQPSPPATSPNRLDGRPPRAHTTRSSYHGRGRQRRVSRDQRRALLPDPPEGSRTSMLVLISQSAPILMMLASARTAGVTFARTTILFSGYDQRRTFHVLCFRCLHLHQLDTAPRDGLACPAAHLNKDGQYECKKHGNACTYCLPSSRNCFYSLVPRSFSLYAVLWVEEADHPRPGGSEEGWQEVISTEHICTLKHHEQCINMSDLVTLYAC
jgi:hypothetical protein